MQYNTLFTKIVYILPLNYEQLQSVFYMHLLVLYMGVKDERVLKRIQSLEAASSKFNSVKL